MFFIVIAIVAILCFMLSLIIKMKKYGNFEKMTLGISIIIASIVSFVFVSSFITSTEEEKKYEIAKAQAVKDSVNSGIQEIRKLYSENVRLFDDYNTDNIEEIIKKAKEKEKSYNQEVENEMKEIKKVAIEKNVFIDDEDKIKPFVELYVMNKNHIPINGKVEQKISPEETGKVCAALEIENCFENSSFIEYNKAKKEREEELARMSKQEDDYTSEILIAGLLIYFFTR